MKIVINKCYGGFGLSEAAIRDYASRKGLTLYPETPDRFSALIGPTWFIKPPGERGDILSNEAFMTAPQAARIVSNKAHAAATLHARDMPRNDPDLVATVEALGKKANDRFGDLTVVEIPDDVEWEIEEYDGKEWVSEKHRTWT